MHYDFTEYQDGAVSTALPQAMTTAYLLPGLAAEVGEVLGVIAKHERQDYGAGTLADRVESELGDVLWFHGVLARVLTPGWKPPRTAPTPCLGPWALLDATIKLHRCVTLNLGRPAIETGLSQVWNGISWTAKEHGLDLALIQATNLGKLRARKAAGTIQGDGEER